MYARLYFSIISSPLESICLGPQRPVTENIRPTAQFGKSALETRFFYTSFRNDDEKLDNILSGD
jgi:hypothetical protein